MEKGQQSDQCENSLHIKTNEMLKQTLHMGKL